MRAKSIVPEAKYNVSYDWSSNNRSNFSKATRHTMATDIERKAKRDLKPDPSTYSPTHKGVEPILKGAFNLQADRTDTGFLAEPLYAGQKSPRFYDKRHSLVEKRVVTKPFYKPINEKLATLKALQH